MEKDIPKSNSRDAIHWRIQEYTKNWPSGDVLDFPSGHGRLSYLLSKKGHKVVACDIQPYEDSPIPHVNGDMTKRFPFDDKSFDYAFCVDGPEHAENLYHLFREFHRVLKPGGILITSMPSFSHLESRLRYLFYGIIEPANSYAQLQSKFDGSPGHGHINRPPYALLRMAAEFAGFQFRNVFSDRFKKKQLFLLPLYWGITLFTLVKGKKGDEKYNLKSSNSWPVLMGGNTMICEFRKLSDNELLLRGDQKTLQ